MIPQKTPSFTKHPKHYHIHLKITLFIPSPPQTPLNAMTCGKPQQTPINLTDRKSICAFIFRAKPLGFIYAWVIPHYEQFFIYLSHFRDIVAYGFLMSTPVFVIILIVAIVCICLTKGKNADQSYVYRYHERRDNNRYLFERSPRPQLLSSGKKGSSLISFFWAKSRFV